MINTDSEMFKLKDQETEQARGKHSRRRISNIMKSRLADPKSTQRKGNELTMCAKASIKF